MEAEAQHDFNPTDPTELAFKRGDKLIILNFGYDVQWYDAMKDGQKGLVPGNYISINAPSWYMGRISRLNAEHMLQSNKNDGAFLVRLSESAPTGFSLSVKYGNSVQHFRILSDADHKYLLWSTRFNNLNELVNHYRNETVSKNSNIYLRDMDSDDQFVAVAIYDFSSNTDQDCETELEFKKGDFITVFDTSDDNWWGGTLGDKSGYFPRLYVQQYSPPNTVCQSIQAITPK